MDHFSNVTLNDNWYENRHLHKQTYRAKPDLKIKRTKEADLNCLTSSGLPAPLNVYNRKPKQETAHLICDDGFRELKTTKEQDYQKPKNHYV